MNFNLILIVVIVGVIGLMVWSAFNTLRQNEIQKNYCARVLTEVAKLWRRAKFVPEDAKERESLYLYRDFLRKFEGEKCQRPLILKNGGVRCMTRQEFDSYAKFKPVKATSLLFTGASVLVGLFALIANFMNNNLLVGLGLAVILPIVQVVMMLFLKKFIKEKDIYRDGIFMALKENCINFVTITKPFIVVDAYPDKFGKNTEPLYVAKGEPTAEQIASIRDFIALQRQADQNFNANRQQNISSPFNLPKREPTMIPDMPTYDKPIAQVFAEQQAAAAMPESYAQPTSSAVEPMANPVTNEPVMPEPTPVMTEPLTASTPSAPVPDEIYKKSFISMVGGQPDQSPVAEKADAAQILDEELPNLSTEEMTEVMENFVDNIIMGKVDEAIAAAKAKNNEQQNTAAEPVMPTAPAVEPIPVAPAPIMPEPTPMSEPAVAPQPEPQPQPAPVTADQSFSVDAPLVDEGEPAEDDFSLEAIGRALDAEIAKRNSGKK